MRRPSAPVPHQSAEERTNQRIVARVPRGSFSGPVNVYGLDAVDGGHALANRSVRLFLGNTSDEDMQAIAVHPCSDPAAAVVVNMDRHSPRTTGGGAGHEAGGQLRKGRIR